MNLEIEYKKYSRLVGADVSTHKYIQVIGTDNRQVMSSVKVPELSFKNAERIAAEHRLFMFGKEDWPEEWVLWVVHAKYEVVDIWQTIPGSMLAQHFGTGKWPDPFAANVFLTQRSQKSLPVGLVASSEGIVLHVEINHFGPPAKLN